MCSAATLIREGEHLAALAAETVEHLIARHPVGELPERAPGWNQAFIGAVCEVKNRYRNSPDLPTLLRIVSEKLYGKEIHWALELIQNAEDEGAHNIVFIFCPDEVLVFNDGRSFTAEGVWAICSAGQSRKKNKIGFFGIGFKSVFLITDCPEIHSGSYAFRIEEKIYPLPLVSKRLQRGARFRLPVKDSEQPRLAAMAEQLTKPDFLQLLLTLNSLEKIHVIDRINHRKGHFYRRITRREQDGWDECVVGGTWPGCNEQVWRRHQRETAPVPADLFREGRVFEPGERSRIVLARPIGSEAVETRIHCFLPLDVPSELGWLIQADFDPTPGRERLVENAWNRWLLGQVGQTLAIAVSIEARLGNAPWPYIALAQEIKSPLQRIAYERMLVQLQETSFIQTRTGWRRPSSVAWPLFSSVPHVVREADLRFVSSPGVSYVIKALYEDLSSVDKSRAQKLFRELSMRPIGCEAALRLLTVDPDQSQINARDSRWWLEFLYLFACHGTDDQLNRLAGFPCIPTSGGRVVAPSPLVSTDGYLVAFSRSDNLSDFQAFFGRFEIALVAPDLNPRTPSSNKQDEALQGMRRVVQHLLESERFRVASEAGPYHVVRHLVLPRMAALRALPVLSQTQVEQLWRMVEYLRQKWPSFCSEYRRFRTATANEKQIAAWLRDQVTVGARYFDGRRWRLRAMPIGQCYLPTAMLGFDGMDVVLQGMSGLTVLDAMHGRPLLADSGKPPRRAKGASGTREALAFLHLLGAHVGPRISQATGEKTSLGVVNTCYEASPHLKWSADSQGRPTGLAEDWGSDEINWLRERWDSWGQKNQRKRSRALWHLIETVWDDLACTATAKPVYYHYKWKSIDSKSPSSWLATLGTFAWVWSTSGAFRYPSQLVIDTKANRAVLGTNGDRIIGWPVRVPQAALALGVNQEPTADDALATLALLPTSHLRNTELQAIARSCYALLARQLGAQLPAPTRLLDTIKEAFMGDGVTGLILLPGQDTRQWWPPSRVIHTDRSPIAGPYLGYLCSRYRDAMLLWQALDIRHDLSPSFIADLIRDSLAIDREHNREDVADWYGELVAQLETFDLEHEPRPRRRVPAYTQSGWVVPSSACWTDRPDMEAAFQDRLHWWHPGARDASALRRTAAWLGIHCLGSSDWPVQERWKGLASEPVDSDLQQRWQRAVQVWRVRVRSLPEGDRAAADDIWNDLLCLRPECAPYLGCHFTTILPGGNEIKAKVDRIMYVDRRRHRFLASSVQALFSREAAAVLATHIPVARLLALDSLAAILGQAFTDPEGFQREVERYLGAVTAHYGSGDAASHSPSEPEGEPSRQEIDAAIKSLKKPLTPAPMPKSASSPNQSAPSSQHEPRLADATRFAVDRLVEFDGKIGAQFRRGERPLRKPKTGGGGWRSPSGPTLRYRTDDIEAAAFNFVALVEWERDDSVLTRQGPKVGADHIAERDGAIQRYIEIKSFGERAPDSFTLTRGERLAALDAEIGPKYWVYVVEHLRDGEIPIVSAVFNPLWQEGVEKEPMGDLRISGWRSAPIGWYTELISASDNSDLVD